MSLNKELQKLKTEVLKSLQPDIRKKLITENAKLFSNHIKDKPLPPGSKIPDIIFFDKDLTEIRLTDILKEHHVVLSFFRGAWCPYCNHELLSLAKIHDEIKSKSAKLIAVSPELYEFTEPFIKDNNLDFSFFVDLANKAADKLGLVFSLTPEYREIYHSLNIHLNDLNGNNSWTLPMPATFIISKDGLITSTYINIDYTQRMEPDDILEQLDKL